jgi:hypothetical protein
VASGTLLLRPPGEQLLAQVLRHVTPSESM